MWDVRKAVKYLTDNAEDKTTGHYSRYVKAAISACDDIKG